MASRTEKTILNVSSNLFVQLIKTIFSFITRTVFIYCLGKEALGLNGLFTNILSMLSLAELGIGTAINFSLYEPLAKKDNDKVSALMSFYKKAYRLIGIIVLILGIIIIPFLGLFIKNINEINNVYIIYGLFLINTVSSYFVSYKETLINADQKVYKLTFLNSIFLILMNVLQMIILIIFKNFVLYLLVQFVIQFIQKISINIYISKVYNDINYSSKTKLKDKDLKIIKKNVCAMIFHKIGDYCINGTDNLIISAFISVSVVGIYSNYLTIILLLTTFITIIFNNTTSSLGNLIATESSEKKYDIFKKMDFIGFILYGCTSVILLSSFNSFITLWIGSDYCFPNLVVFLIVLNFYLTGMRVVPSTLKSAAGLYDIDKFTPIIQAVVNLIISIVAAKYIGIIGVLLGTLISSLVLPAWQRPYIVYKYILGKDFREYVIKFFENISFLTIVYLVSYLLFSNMALSNIYLVFLFKVIFTMIVYLILLIFFYKKNNEYLFVVELIKKTICRRGKK